MPASALVRRAILDTSVLDADAPPIGVEGAISVVSIVELHFGALLASDFGERSRRQARLAAVEATFDPVPVSVKVARCWGRLATAAVAQRGGNPRRRQLDLAIAATSVVEGVPLLTLNIADFSIIHELVDVRTP